MISRIRRGTRSMTFCLTFLSVLLFSAPLLAQRSRIPVPQKRSPTQQKVPLPEVLVMRVDDDKITADIRNSPLQKVLGELAERTGIVFEIRSEDNPLVSVHLYGVSFQEAIQRIASDNNTIFYYDRDKPTRITYVRVFPRTSSVKQPSIIYLGTGSVTKSNDDIDTPEQALSILAENASPEARIKAIEILSQTRSVEAIEALLKSVSDPEAEIRIAAIESLAELGVHEALAGIIKSLKDPDPGVRQSAIMAVALLGDESNLKDLEPLRMDDHAGVAAAVETAVQRLSTSLKE
jgi:hypothetical protein